MQGRVAMVGDDRGQRIDQVKRAVGASPQAYPAGGTEPPTIERGCDFLLTVTWQREWQKGIVGRGGRGRFGPAAESGVSDQSLCDSTWLYHAHQQICAMG